MPVLLEENNSSNISLQTSDIVSIMDINKIQSALQSLKEERVHIEEYLQNAAVKKKELEKNRNVHLIHIIEINNKKQYYVSI